MMGFTDNHRKQVKFFTNTPMTLQSKNMFLVQRIQYIGKMSSWDPNLGLMLGLAVTHCVLLEHYYSVYFPWWFDRKNCFTKTANDNDFFSVKWQKLKLHLVISQKNCLCLTSLDDQIFKSFWKPNPWMNLLEKKIYYISFCSSFCRASPFHREWPQLVTILISFDLSFEKKFKSLKY